MEMSTAHGRQIFLILNINESKAKFVPWVDLQGIVMGGSSKVCLLLDQTALQQLTNLFIY